MKRKKKTINKKKNSKRKVNILKVENNRLLFFTGLCILLFGVLFCKLYFVMLIDEDVYAEELEQLSYDIVEGSSAPRGRILDRNGKVLVDNNAVKTIIFKKDKSLTAEEEVELAYNVSSHISLDFSKLSLRNKKEFWLAKYPDKARDLIKTSEYKKEEERKLSPTDIENLKISRISDEELNKFSDEDNKAAYLYYLMNKGYTYDEKVIKYDDVSDEEYAYIAEHNSELKGFNTKLDWKRVYPYGDVFKTMLGNVSSPTSGIPAEDKDEYLKKGYSLNDRVGISYIEKEYENYLKGEKEEYQVLNSHELKLIKSGKRGNDIVLSIDIDLQRAVEDILAREVLSTKGEANTGFYNHSFVVLQEPNTGEILAMAGKQVVRGDNGYEVRDYTPAILTSPVTPGSVVKGASMLVGYNTGNVQIGEYMIDECIKVAGAPEKCSSQTLGRINDIDALARSSNVYQFKIAMRVAGVKYYYDTPFPLNQKAFDTYRSMYHSFGLGVKTGIDLPVESLGYSSRDTQGGNLLDFVMGQYETYTTLQLSQYVTTIANGGKRLQPHLLKEVHESSNTDELGKVIYSFEPKVLNTIDTKPEYLARVKEGFYAVVNSAGGYGRGYISPQYQGSGKTGTSQSFLDTDEDGVIDTETISTAFIGYAPTNNPRFSITVTSPDSSYPNGSSDFSSYVTRRITKEITDRYFEMYP